MIRKRIINFSMAIAFVIAIVLLFIYDPTTAGFSYHCPVKSLTGFDCPGCGGQRAVHAMLHFRVKEALAYNPFLVIVTIYLASVIIIRCLKGPRIDKIRRFILGETMVWIYLVLMIIWTIARNTIL